MKIPLKFFISFIFLFLFLFSIPFGFATLDPDFDGEIPDFVSLFLNNGSTINATGDFSVNPQNFTGGPPTDEVWRISRLLITIIDTNIKNFNEYGALPKLTNGLKIGVVIDNSTKVLNPLRNVTDNFMVRTNGDWAKLMFDLDIKDLGAGNDYVVGRWTFDKAGTKIRLDGAKRDHIFIEFNDDLSGLVGHEFLIQGYIERANEAEESNQMILIFGLIFVIAIVLLILAFHKENVTLGALSGMLFIITALFLWFNGIDLGTSTLNNWWTRGTELILFGVGVYVMIAATLEDLIENMNLLK